MTETEITCDDCGEDATVPFKPTKGRPVYCQDCFEKRKKSKGGRNRKKQNWDRSEYHGYDPSKHAADQPAS
jgi:CxxC-x17-CxxC domain-containing protein